MRIFLDCTQRINNNIRETILPQFKDHIEEVEDEEMSDMVIISPDPFGRKKRVFFHKNKYYAILAKNGAGDRVLLGNVKVFSILWYDFDKNLPAFIRKCIRSFLPAKV